MSDERPSASAGEGERGARSHLRAGAVSKIGGPMSRKRKLPIAVAIVIATAVFVGLVVISSRWFTALPQYVLDARKPNTTASRYLNQAPAQRDDVPPGKTLILFVHGLFGDTVGTWSRDGKQGMGDIVLALPEFSDNFDAFAFGYASSLVKTGSFRIPEAAKALEAEIRFRQFLQRYKSIVIVAHSMGGLVVLEALTTYPDLMARVPVVVTFATPYQGSQVAVLKRRVLENPAIEDMLPGDENTFLLSLASRWKEAKGSTRTKTRVVCAYEKVPIVGLGLVVPATSGSGLCDGAADAIAEDHIGIVKPSSAEAASIKVLVNALRQLPALTTATADEVAVEQLRAQLIRVLRTVNASLIQPSEYIFPTIQSYLAEPTPERWSRVTAECRSALSQVRQGMDAALEYDSAFVPSGDTAHALINSALLVVDRKFQRSFTTTRRIWNERARQFEEIPQANIGEGLPDGQQVRAWHEQLRFKYRELKSELERLVNSVGAAAGGRQPKVGNVTVPHGARVGGAVSSIEREGLQDSLASVLASMIEARWHDAPRQPLVTAVVQLRAQMIECQKWYDAFATGDERSPGAPDPRVEWIRALSELGRSVSELDTVLGIFDAETRDHIAAYLSEESLESSVHNTLGTAAQKLNAQPDYDLKSETLRPAFAAAIKRLDVFLRKNFQPSEVHAAVEATRSRE